jgi:two-component system, LytTR family, response regulator
METIKCLVIDDEPPALNLLEGYISRTPFLELSGSCTDAYKALEYIELIDVQLLFLDIHMPEFSGIELSRTLKRNKKVIFTTAFPQYAIEGYKVDAVDYLLKPFNYTEFLKAAVKAQDRIQWENICAVRKRSATVLFIQSEGRLVKVDLTKVLYIQSIADSTKITMIDAGESVLTSMSLKELEENLPAERFIRIHRSFIVNLSQILALERSQVIIGNERITLRDHYIDKLNQYISGRLIHA